MHQTIGQWLGIGVRYSPLVRIGLMGYIGPQFLTISLVRSSVNLSSHVQHKALSTLSQKSGPVALFCDSRCFLRQIVAEIDHYSRQCGQSLRTSVSIVTFI